MDAAKANARARSHPRTGPGGEFLAATGPDCHAQGNDPEADAIIDEGLAATNNNANLLWAKASCLERDGDIDGAIGIYEGLYAQNSGSIIVANNLASLLSTYRQDDESLERAWVIARRLRDAEVPAFQDTYGWIASGAARPRRPCPIWKARPLGCNDPIVQAHLGLSMWLLGRNQEAWQQMQKAVDVAGPADTGDRIEEARAEITRLRAWLRTESGGAASVMYSLQHAPKPPSGQSFRLALNR